MTTVTKMLDDRVYPYCKMKMPCGETNLYYFDWKLGDPEDDDFRIWEYPNHFAYYINASKLTKYKRQELYSYYEKIKKHFEAEDWKIEGGLRFHRIKKEIYKQEIFATLKELDKDPRADEEWR